MTQKKQLIIWGSIGVLAIGIGIRLAIPASIPSLDGQLTKSAAPPASPSHSEPAPPLIKVQVSGQVRHPGLFTVIKGTRVQAVIDTAGGLLSDADDSAINYAGKLRDGQHLKVPKIHTGKLSKSRLSRPSSSAFDINTATKADIQSHYSISASAARNIIKYREQMGWIRDESEIQDLITAPVRGGKKSH
jgi:competence protein ComEA